MRKLMALMSGILILGLALATAQETTQAKAQEKAKVQTELKAKGEARQNQLQTKSTFRHGYRIAFIDENGDGINDLAKDADGDGIPNGQDPDWVKPADGTGYKEQRGRAKDTLTAAAEAKAGHAYQLARDDDGDGIPNGQDPDWVKPADGTGYMGQRQNDKASFAKGSFRTGLQGAARATGAGVCDGTGPKGNAKKKGGR
jgi:hypothetical protein